MKRIPKLINDNDDKWLVYTDKTTNKLMVTNIDACYPLDDAMDMLKDFLRLEVEAMDMENEVKARKGDE